LHGPWETTSTLKVYYHEKSDCIFTDQDFNDHNGEDLRVIGKFGDFAIPLKFTIDDVGDISAAICWFDLAIFKVKLEKHGFKNYILSKANDKDEMCLKFSSEDELAMFQLYFGEFIA
jgi:hypothetical protein